MFVTARRWLIILGLLAAAPLAAQHRPIAPASSRLFAPDASADTTSRRPGLSPIEGGMMGAGLGLVIGFAAGTIHESQYPCGCEDPGLQKIEYALVGSLVGFVVGLGLAGRD